jgi:hypothetical protein
MPFHLPGAKSRRPVLRSLLLRALVLTCACGNTLSYPDAGQDGFTCKDDGCSKSCNDPDLVCDSESNTCVLPSAPQCVFSQAWWCDGDRWAVTCPFRALPPTGPGCVRKGDAGLETLYCCPPSCGPLSGDPCGSPALTYRCAGYTSPWSGGISPSAAEAGVACEPGPWPVDIDGGKLPQPDYCCAYPGQCFEREDEYCTSSQREIHCAGDAMPPVAAPPAASYVVGHTITAYCYDPPSSVDDAGGSVLDAGVPPEAGDGFP